MFSRGYHRVLFPDVRLGGYARFRGTGTSRELIFNVRAAWSEAEIFVMRQLRMGCHPDLLEREIASQLLVTHSMEYTHLCLRYALRILRNLRNSGQFDGLPTFHQFEQIRLIRARRASYEMTMYDRFRNFEVVSRFGRDIDIAREIARSRALDREAEEELRMMREQDHIMVEEQYRANEEALRAELQEASFLAEAAEGRLRFERIMARMPAATYGPVPYPYVPVAAPPAPPRMPEPYYVPDMNGGNQYNGYREDQMPNDFRDGFQQPRPYQPGQYQ